MGLLTDLLGDGNGASSSFVAVYKSANETVTNSATLQDDDELLFALGTDEKWVGRFVLFPGNVATGDGFKVALTVPTGASIRYSGLAARTSDTIAQQSGVMATASGTSMNLAIRGSGPTAITYGVIEFSVANGATAGNLQLRWAQAVVNAGATELLAGSYIQAFKVPS